MLMYSFSWIWFFVGIIVSIVGALTLKYYDKVSEAVGSGVVGYQRWKIVGLVTFAAGVFIALNLHTLIIEFVARLIFGGVIGN